MFPDYLEVANRVWFCKKKKNNSKIKHKKKRKTKRNPSKNRSFSRLFTGGKHNNAFAKKKQQQKSKNNPNKLFISDGLLVPDYSEVTTAVVVPRIGGRTSPHISI